MMRPAVLDTMCTRPGLIRKSGQANLSLNHRYRQSVSEAQPLGRARSTNTVFAQKLIIMRRSSNLVRNRLRQQAGNLNGKTRSLARPVPYRVRLIEFLDKATNTRYRNPGSRRPC